MSYDFTAGETGENARKHQANLYPSDLSLPGYSVDDMVNNLIELVCHQKNINLEYLFMVAWC
mgnify:CR=1 FL=1